MIPELSEAPTSLTRKIGNSFWSNSFMKSQSLSKLFLKSSETFLKIILESFRNCLKNLNQT